MSEESLEAYLLRQEEWSARTFGHGTRTGGVTAHIEKELSEVREKPFDLAEWVDIIILALDGYWRHGGDPKNIMRHLQEKQNKNFARTWPASTSEDVAVEHDRTAELTARKKMSTYENVDRGGLTVSGKSVLRYASQMLGELHERNPDTMLWEHDHSYQTLLDVAELLAWLGEQ